MAGGPGPGPRTRSEDQSEVQSEDESGGRVRGRVPRTSPRVPEDGSPRVPGHGTRAPSPGTPCYTLPCAYTGYRPAGRYQTGPSRHEVPAHGGTVLGLGLRPRPRSELRPDPSPTRLVLTVRHPTKGNPLEWPIGAHARLGHVHGHPCTNSSRSMRYGLRLSPKAEAGTRSGRGQRKTEARHGRGMTRPIGRGLTSSRPRPGLVSTRLRLVSSRSDLVSTRLHLGYTSVTPRSHLI